ncbi:MULTISPECIES: DNA polymerase/3'-5' exonuclease PolX [unclassified Exiguobacterium]|uniref:DNA polymerase/3'-5' exonuclease PolX n=1 Tax=unclassified Exiguobacterium TaxID=2644629 RepID=UPI001BE8AC4D|nr:MULTISPECIES: DNA polymerase/3'-5' exonuclease PolX [unclassified Exiguobacterium]
MNKVEAMMLLEKIAQYMEIKGENPFKINAFRKAATALENMDLELEDIEDLTSVSGIGKGTAAVLEEYRDTGRSEVLEALQEEIPFGLMKLLKIQGLGGKKLAKLREVGVVDLESLIRVLEDGTAASLSGFGAKSVEKLLAAAKNLESRPERLAYAVMRPIVEEINDVLKKEELVLRHSVGGSFRRAEETCKDLDFIIATEEPIALREKLLALPFINEVIAAGETKVSLVLEREEMVSVDFRMVEPGAFAATLHHFTGSKDHNVRMRQLAKAKGESISEYGVETVDGLWQPKTEEELFERYGFPFIPPELREGHAEFEHDLSKLVTLEDIKADAHMHTVWSDGKLTVDEIVVAMKGRGYEWMAITDHGKYLTFVNGLTEERLEAQGEEIREAAKTHDMNVLRGVEMDIRPDGTLDYEPEFLETLDYVVASIHSKMDQSVDEIMARLENACRSPYVNVIAHPTGRLIGRRDGYPIDEDKLIALAKETGTALELNANPNRLDLTASTLKKAKAAGVKVMINTDTHHPDMMEDMALGVLHARKAYLEPSDIINCFTFEDAKAFFAAKR